MNYYEKKMKKPLTWRGLNECHCENAENGTFSI